MTSHHFKKTMMGSTDAGGSKVSILCNACVHSYSWRRCFFPSGRDWLDTEMSFILLSWSGGTLFPSPSYIITGFWPKDVGRLRAPAARSGQDHLCSFFPLVKLKMHLEVSRATGWKAVVPESLHGELPEQPNPCETVT